MNPKARRESYHSPVDRKVHHVTEFDFPNVEEFDKFLAEKFPTAKHEGVGYWRVPRQYHLSYSGAHPEDTPYEHGVTLTVEVMGGRLEFYA